MHPTKIDFFASANPHKTRLSVNQFKLNMPILEKVKQNNFASTVFAFNHRNKYIQQKYNFNERNISELPIKKTINASLDQKYGNYKTKPGLQKNHNNFQRKGKFGSTQSMPKINNKYFQFQEKQQSDQQRSLDRIQNNKKMSSISSKNKSQKQIFSSPIIRKSFSKNTNKDFHIQRDGQQIKIIKKESAHNNSPKKQYSIKNITIVKKVESNPACFNPEASSQLYYNYPPKNTKKVYIQKQLPLCQIQSPSPHKKIFNNKNNSNNALINQFMKTKRLNVQIVPKFQGKKMLKVNLVKKQRYNDKKLQSDGDQLCRWDWTNNDAKDNHYANFALENYK